MKKPKNPWEAFTDQELRELAQVLCFGNALYMSETFDRLEVSFRRTMLRRGIEFIEDRIQRPCAGQ